MYAASIGRSGLQQQNALAAPRRCHLQLVIPRLGGAVLRDGSASYRCHTQYLLWIRELLKLVASWVTTTECGQTASTFVLVADLRALSREIMDAVLPPKTWQDTQGKWQRMVGIMPATRTDTEKLQETFDQLLEQYQARVHAICPVREKFFLQLTETIVVVHAEELIREVECECPERGLMLLRVRDELRLTIEAHQTLYHNSIAYGRQKAVQAEAGVGELDNQISRLQAERDPLEAKKKQPDQNIMSSRSYSVPLVEMAISRESSPGWSECETALHVAVPFRNHPRQASAFLVPLPRIEIRPWHRAPNTKLESKVVVSLVFREPCTTGRTPATPSSNNRKEVRQHEFAKPFCYSTPTETEVEQVKTLSTRELNANVSRELSDCGMFELADRSKPSTLSSWIATPSGQQAREMLQGVMAELPISDVTQKKRQVRKDQLKWSSALDEIRQHRRRSSRDP
ncbi:hypothetical protein ON010_g2705 [Phytophthora cinnamomi]|nr:hypothetical protein ON010_g2705 [Phytophthora cinnamomi]